MAPKLINTYFKESNILLRTFSGTITCDYLIEKWKEDIANGKVSASLKGVISNLVDAELSFDLKALRKLQAFYKKQSEIFLKIKMAQVIDNPHIVYSKIFEKRKGNSLQEALAQRLLPLIG